MISLRLVLKTNTVLPAQDTAADQLSKPQIACAAKVAALPASVRQSAAA